MDKFVVRIPRKPGPSRSEGPVIHSVTQQNVIRSVKRSHPISVEDSGSSSIKRTHGGEVDLSCLESDPGLRRPISDYPLNEQDRIRRAYLIKGPCQPDHAFNLAQFGTQQRRINSEWFDEFGSWIEYSISKDAAFCLYCYLFKGRLGSDCFVLTGSRDWKNKERLRDHVGRVGSGHNNACMLSQNLLNQYQHIAMQFDNQIDQAREVYKDRLEAFIKVVRLLLQLGLPFGGHEEIDESERQCNFHAVLEFLVANNTKARNVLKNAQEDAMIATPMVQRDIVRACAIETLNVIRSDIGDAFFAIVVNDSCDLSMKEQLVVVVRYVDRRGCVMERVIGFIHVVEITSLTLKKGVDELFSKLNLSTTKLRGQGYGDASNIQDEINGLKELITKENKYAFFIYCFAHQFQTTLVNVSKNLRPIMNFFEVLSETITLVGSETITLVGSSCKRKVALREFLLKKIVDVAQSGEQLIGCDLDEEASLERAINLCWGSHYETLLRFIDMFSTLIDLLDIIDEDGSTNETRGKAESLGDIIVTFDFAFKLHMMRRILEITNDLSKSLQQKDQDIVNAMHLVKMCKQRFQELRDGGWDNLLAEVCLFCNKNDIDVPDMNYKFVAPCRSRNEEEITNRHHYQAELFYVVIDMQVNELENCFSEVGIDLLLCIACLNPNNSFSAFDKMSLLRLARFYESDFSTIDVLALDDELDLYYLDMRTNIDFSGLKGIADLAIKLVETGKHIVYPLIYSLITFALILPVTTATVERVFSAMKLVKTLCIQIGDGWTSDALVTYIEQDVFSSLSIKTIAKRFQDLRSRREQLPLDY